MFEKEKRPPELEESNEPVEEKNYFPWTIFIIVGLFAILMAACIIVIYATGGPL